MHESGASPVFAQPKVDPFRVKFSENKSQHNSKAPRTDCLFTINTLYSYSSTTANNADKLLAAFYLCCLRITTLVVLIMAYCPCRCSHWHRQWLFAYRCRLLYARTTFRQGGPYFAGKNWTGGSTFYPGPIIA